MDTLAPTDASLVDQTTAVLAALAAVPEQQLWLAGHRSANTRRAYRSDLAKFLAFYRITSPEQLRQVDRAAVLAYQRQLEASGARAATIARNLTALSSLFSHLVDHGHLPQNPCDSLKRPRRNARRGTTPAFSREQARLLLDAPDPTTLQGLRDRAILSVGLQAGPRRASIVSLRVRDFRQDRGLDSLRFVWKGGFAHTVALHPETGERIREYLEAAGHGSDLDGPLFRPARARVGESRRHLDAKMIDILLKRYCRVAGIKGRFSAHSMRATFITTALTNGAPLERVQDDAGHADPRTTRLYDQRRFVPEESSAFFASY